MDYPLAASSSLSILYQVGQFLSDLTPFLDMLLVFAIFLVIFSGLMFIPKILNRLIK